MEARYLKQFSTEAPESLTIPSGIPDGFQETGPEGLSAAEAASRERAGKSNKVRDTASRSVLQILSSNLLTFFNFLNIALALCLVLVRSYRNMLFLGVVISNTVIGTAQELRARRTVKKLQLMQPSLVTCIRDGAQVRLQPAELVRDMRLKHACILLKRTNINMSELATNVGFLTAENFISIFREKFGMTPLEYRLKHRK